MPYDPSPVSVWNWLSPPTSAATLICQAPPAYLLTLNTFASRTGNSENGLKKDDNELWQPATEEFEPKYLDMKSEDEVSSPVNVGPAEIKNVGGIDLNPALFDLQIKRDGEGTPLP